MTQTLANAEYDSVTAFIEAANNECLHKSSKPVHHAYAQGKQGADWLGAGCETGLDVQRMISEGWPEGRSKALNLLGEIDTSILTPRDMRRRIVRRDMGDSLDIAAIYAGRHQTAWTIARRQSGLAPLRVDIVANMLCSGFEDSDVLFWRGACAIALADCLESAGFMVRIVVGFGGDHGRGGRVSCRITVKDHGKPLDISTTAAIALPGFFRALGHGWIAGHCANGVGSSPGISVGQCNLDMDSSEVLISHSVRSRETALQWLKTNMTEINERYSPAA